MPATTDISLIENSVREFIQIHPEHVIRQLSKNAKSANSTSDLEVNPELIRLGVTEMAAHMAVGLYSLHPLHSENAGNFGASMGRLHKLLGGDDEQGKTVADRRFFRMIKNQYKWMDLVKCVRTVHEFGPELHINYVQLAADLHMIADGNSDPGWQWAQAYVSAYKD